MKKMKGLKTAHTSNSQMGMGDFYGSGIKQKVGRVREDYINMPSKKTNNIKKPPKSLA